MATLIVRKLDDALVQRLKARAKAHGRSAEAEHRAILEEALPAQREMTGAEFVAALRGDGPFLEDDDEFWKILEELDEPVEVPDLFE
jgi:antitoxin FitA